MRRSAVAVAAGSAFLALIAACERTPTSSVDEASGQHTPAAEAGTLTGYIPVDSVRPAVGITVNVIPLRGSTPVATVQTDQTGTFTARVEAGLYEAVMTVPAGLYRPAGSPERVTVAVTANETVQVHGFVLTSTAPPVGNGIDGAMVRGEARVEGLGTIAGTLVVLHKDGVQLQRTSDANGLFDFGVIDIGQWQLAATPPAGYILAWGEQSPRPLNFLRKGDSLFFQVSLATADGTGRVRVQVVADSATALPGVVVRALNGSTVVGTATTTTNGPSSSAMLVLPPATYSIEVVPPAGYELMPGYTARIDDITVRTGRLETAFFALQPTG